MGADHFIAGAAMIGGISYFHAYAYDLLATNERIMAASVDAALAAHRSGRLRKVTYMSSSMVYESQTAGLRSRETSASPAPRCRLTASKNWLSSTSLMPHGTSTSFRTRSFARSIASGWGGAGTWRRRSHLRQRQTGDEPRCARSGAKGTHGTGPVAHSW